LNRQNMFNSYVIRNVTEIEWFKNQPKIRGSHRIYNGLFVFRSKLNLNFEFFLTFGSIFLTLSLVLRGKVSNIILLISKYVDKTSKG